MVQTSLAQQHALRQIGHVQFADPGLQSPHDARTCQPLPSCVRVTCCVGAVKDAEQQRSGVFLALDCESAGS
eukprot:762883-Rhodomonas_salina.2